MIKKMISYDFKQHCFCLIVLLCSLDDSLIAFSACAGTEVLIKPTDIVALHSSAYAAYMYTIIISMRHTIPRCIS